MSLLSRQTDNRYYAATKPSLSGGVRCSRQQRRFETDCCRLLRDRNNNSKIPGLSLIDSSRQPSWAVFESRHGIEPAVDGSLLFTQAIAMLVLLTICKQG